MLYINIDPDDSYKKKKLIDNISELCSIQKEPEFSLSNLASIDSDVKKEKKTKKKKVKKKKETNLTSMLDDSSVINNLDEEESYSELMNTDVDAIKLLISEGESNIADVIIGEGRDYNKYKKSQDKLVKEFGPELTYLYDLLDELNSFGKELDTQFKFISSSKARGMSKTSNDLTSNIITNKKTKLDVVKEIAVIKKTIEELKIKHENANSKRPDAENMSNETAAAMYMSNIMKAGRNNFVEALENNDEKYNNYELDKALNNLSSDYDNDWDEEQPKQSKFDGYYDEDDIEEIDSLIDDRLQNEDYHARTESGDKYIMFENQQPSIMIKKCVDNGDWDFIAVNKDKQELVGYPLPDKELIGKMRFSADGNMATDKYGRTYKVVEYYSEDIM